MILLWCLCGFTTAFCIGRYNQSNKLFWALFTSFVIGIAAAAVYNKYTQQHQSEVRTVQVCPMQDDSTTNIFQVTFDAEQAMCNTMPALAGQDTTPEQRSHIAELEWVNLPVLPPPRNA